MLYNKIYKIGLFLVLLVYNAVSFSQSFAQVKKAGMFKPSEEPDLDSRPKNNIFINICGDGSMASLNYERLFFISPKHFFIAAGVGAGVNFYVKIHINNSTTYSSEQYMIIPHHVTCNIGRGRHFLELGGGGAILSGPRAQPYLPYVTAGYRIQPWNNNKMLFRLFVSYPLESIDKFEIVYIPAGVSVGWSF